MGVVPIFKAVRGYKKAHSVYAKSWYTVESFTQQGVVPYINRLLVFLGVPSISSAGFTAALSVSVIALPLPHPLLMDYPSPPSQPSLPCNPPRPVEQPHATVLMEILISAT
ncbi:hypothetical protein J6590_073264 [Homalodisca vitripennis]|nr:hypothetical protein J6590_073264 [Homalodisca vitripennis]